jgi:hypothetical protein
MRRVTLFMLFMFSSLAFGQSLALGPRVPTHLTNQDIIALTKIGLSDEVIIAKIRSAETVKFDTSVEGLETLKAEKVSEAVMKVMINPVAAAEARDLNLPPEEVGVYWKNGPTFVLIPGQALSQTKVGGRTGSLLTYGFKPKHWDAYVDGPMSKNHVKDTRPLLYLYVPDGASASDFVLIRLEQKDDRREFQVGSFGGVATVRSGIQKEKQIPFKSEHVAVRTYKITLYSDLRSGEYAFVMATGEQVMSSSSFGGSGSGAVPTGRIFDFNIPE